MTDGDLDFVRALIERNRYLTLSTTDGDEPWIAPLEYICDENMNLYFFSPETSAHAKHIERNSSLAVAIFDAEQPEYEPAPVVRYGGGQMT
ncbi:MAG: pyridoxamine 5'-phosphate oxidase family protein, partial [Pseudomonadales bacterium]|nr:pyridoxamine 5'-phosphate oxidase family protein [Pseudomonadales bacterium]